MPTRLTLLAASALLAGAYLTAANRAEAPKKEAAQPLNDLSMEVEALRRLHQFKFTPAQMHKLQQWAKETVPQKDRARQPAKASQELRQRLQELHNALVDASDDDMIDQANETYDQLRESEKPSLEDDVDITDAARARAGQALRLLKAHQLAAVYAGIADEVVDPLDRLTESLESVRALKTAEWKDKRDEIAEEISRHVVGVDLDKSDKFSCHVVALLSRARGLSDREFKEQRPELEKAARQLVGEVSPADVLRHHTEYALAELLSNPRLPAALRARLK